MSLRRNILANYAGIVTTTLMTFLVVPFYLRWLGADAYGLVGVAAMVQGWLMLLNAGLSPVVGRQAAQSHAGVANWMDTARFFRTVEWLVGLLSILAMCGMAFASHWLALHWLKATSLPSMLVAQVIVLFCLNILLRLASSINSGVLQNMEQQLWQNGNLIVFSVLRFAVSLPIVWYSHSVQWLFAWWVMVSMGEYLSIRSKIARLLPVSVPLFTFDLVQLRRHGKMAATLAFTSTVWVMITNLDRLVLSGLLPLADYGRYSIATLLASGVLLLAQPVTQAFQPRLSAAFARGGLQPACDEFRRCTRLVVLITFPVAAVLLAMPETALLVWTGNAHLATATANILRGYVLGNALLAAGGLLYFLQVAIGNVRWHLRGNIIFAVLLVPAIPWVAGHYGALGAAALWALINLMLFVLWNSLLLLKLAPALWPVWIARDVLWPLVVVVTLAFLLSLSPLAQVENRLSQLLVLAGMSLFCLTALLPCVPEARYWIRTRLERAR